MLRGPAEPDLSIPTNGIAIAVGPDGAYAGAFVATGDATARVIAALERGDADGAIAESAGAEPIAHGKVARHPVATAADRRAAYEYLCQILVKPQDNAITRYLFRPVSSRISRVLVHAPITATQVSIVVAILAIVTLGTAGMSTAAAPTSAFPLRDGNRWLMENSATGSSSAIAVNPIAPPAIDAKAAVAGLAPRRVNRLPTATLTISAKHEIRITISQRDPSPVRVPQSMAEPTITPTMACPALNHDPGSRSGAFGRDRA